MEINLNFVLFEELQEKADGSGAVARIVIIRESRDSNLALEEGTSGLQSLE
jgi:hypothetical protein